MPKHCDRVSLISILSFAILASANFIDFQMLKQPFSNVDEERGVPWEVCHAHLSRRIVCGESNTEHEKGIGVSAFC